MHRTEGTNFNVVGGKNMYTNGPPATTIEENGMNALQEEICYVIEQSGATLKTASTESDYSQLNTAITAIAASSSGDFTISGGRLIIEDGVSFRAYPSSSQNSINSDVKLLFGTEDFDLGSNIASSRFTAPVAGRYLFCLVSEIQALTSTLNLKLRLDPDGTPTDYLISSIDGAGGSAAQNTSGSVILNLAANDEVEVWGITADVSWHHAAGDSHWSGTLLAY